MSLLRAGARPVFALFVMAHALAHVLMPWQEFFQPANLASDTGPLILIGVAVLGFMQDLSLLATLRQLLPNAALVLMTAFGTPEILSDAMALGAAVINKPFELSDLTRLVAGSN